MTRKITRYTDISESVYRPFGNAHKIADVRRSSKVETIDALWARGLRTVDEIYAAIVGPVHLGKDPGMQNAKRKIARYLATKNAQAGC